MFRRRESSGDVTFVRFSGSGIVKPSLRLNGFEGVNSKHRVAGYETPMVPHAFGSPLVAAS